MKFVLLFVLFFLAVYLLLGSSGQAQTSPVPPPLHEASACRIENPPTNCNELWQATDTINVPNGAYVHVPHPCCMNDVNGQILQMIQIAIAARNPILSNFSGPISSVLAAPVGQFFRAHGGGDFGRLLSPFARNGALCAPLVVTMPVEGIFVGYRLLAAEAGGGFSVCTPGIDCGIGWSKFQKVPN